MAEHTTHFDDCGCKSKALEAERDALRLRVAALEARGHADHCFADATAIGPAGRVDIIMAGGNPDAMPQPCTCGLGDTTALRALLVEAVSLARLTGMRDQQFVSGGFDVTEPGPSDSVLVDRILGASKEGK